MTAPIAALPASAGQNVPATALRWCRWICSHALRSETVQTETGGVKEKFQNSVDKPPAAANSWLEGARGRCDSPDHSRYDPSAGGCPARRPDRDHLRARIAPYSRGLRRAWGDRRGPHRPHRLGSGRARAGAWLGRTA